MMCSKARSSVREPGRVPAGFRSGLPLSAGFFSDTPPSLSAWLDKGTEAVPSGATSATRYDFTERVFAVPHIVAELKFVDVKRHVGFRHLVIGADDAALEQAPKAFNRVGVDHAVDVLASGMPNDRMRELEFDVAVARPFVRHDQFDLIGDGLAHEAGQDIGAHGIDHARDDL